MRNVSNNFSVFSVNIITLFKINVSRISQEIKILFMCGKPKQMDFKELPIEIPFKVKHPES